MEVVVRKRKRGAGGRPKINDFAKDQIVKLYNGDDMTCKEIAKACGVSEASVYRVIRERRGKANGTEKDNI